MSKEQGLETLNVWRRAMDFAVRICFEILPSFPADERYALCAQLRRAVQSIPANIAEGYGRFHYNDSTRFCYIAWGSLEETRSHLIYAREMGYILDDVYSPLSQEMESLRRMINGYISYLKTNRPGDREPGSTVHEEEPDYLVPDYPPDINEG